MFQLLNGIKFNIQTLAKRYKNSVFFLYNLLSFFVKIIIAQHCPKQLLTYQTVIKLFLNCFFECLSTTTSLSKHISQ